MIVEAALTDSPEVAGEGKQISAACGPAAVVDGNGAAVEVEGCGGKSPDGSRCARENDAAVVVHGVGNGARAQQRAAGDINGGGAKGSSDGGIDQESAANDLGSAGIAVRGVGKDHGSTAKLRGCVGGPGSGAGDLTVTNTD